MSSEEATAVECKPLLERQLPKNATNLCWFDTTNTALFHKKRNIFERQKNDSSKKLFMDIYKYYSCGEIEGGKTIHDLYKEFRNDKDMNDKFNTVAKRSESDILVNDGITLTPYKKTIQKNKLQDDTEIQSNLYSFVMDKNPSIEQIEERIFYPIMNEQGIQDEEKASTKTINVIQATENISINVGEKRKYHTQPIKVITKKTVDKEGKNFIDFSVIFKSFDETYKETFDETYSFFIPEEEYSMLIQKEGGKETTEFSISAGGFEDVTEYMAKIINFCNIPDDVFPLRTAQKIHVPIVDILVDNSQDQNTIQNVGFLQDVNTICEQDMLIVRFEVQKEDLSTKHICETMTFYPTTGECVYKLDSIAVRVNKNHYFTLVKEGDDWYKYDDLSITDLSTLQGTPKYTFSDIMEQKNGFTYDLRVLTRFLVYSKE
jgi:hypothetical protein